MTGDPCDLFVPDEFISIKSGSGHIGRFYWDNQKQFTVEVFGDNYHESTTSEMPGSCALVCTMGDWWAWLLS